MRILGLTIAGFLAVTLGGCVGTGSPSLSADASICQPPARTANASTGVDIASPFWSTNAQKEQYNAEIVAMTTRGAVN